MSKKCPNCLEIYDDVHGFCSNCGSRLVDYFEDLVSDPVLNLGDANAISGGVNINRSKNITSHDTHYHSTTVHERTKSEMELKLEAANELRLKAEEIISTRGRIDSVAMGQLRPFASQLGIDDETFKTIIKEVRSNRNGGASGLGAANARYLQQAQQAVQTNDMDGLSNLTPRLEAMAAISLDDNVQYLYYLTLSLLYPIKSMEVYELQTDENYWRSFWAIISYVRTGKYAEATKVLALFDPVRFEKSEDDQNLLEAYFNIMKEENDGAQDFLDEILGEPSEQIKPLHRAIEATLYEEDPDSLEVRFYFERVLSKSDVVIKTSKKVEPTPSVEEVVPSTNKEKKKTVNTINTDDNNTLPKSNNNIQADVVYSEACAASGVKRVMLLQKAAEAGSLDAMYDLSNCYCDGEGVNKDMGLAVKWLTKAADGGLLIAQTVLGGLYFHGDADLEQNYVLSEKYLRMAAEKENSMAQGYLSALYLVMEEDSKALIWANKAAQSGNSEAFCVLGTIFSDGLGGVVIDLEKAFQYYQKSALQNHEYGMYYLGLCYANGNGCQCDMGKAHEWIERAANEGCPEAQEWLKNNSFSDCDFINEDRYNMTPDEEIDYANSFINNNDISRGEECVAIYRKHANNGLARGQHNLAYCYHIGFGVKQNFQQAASWYKKAAEQGFAPAQLALGLKFDEGHGCGVNYQEAAKWYRKAAEQGDPEAQFRLGLLYQDGNGVVKNQTKALDFIKKSAEQNFSEAETWIKNNAVEGSIKSSKVKTSQKPSNKESTTNNGFEIKNVNITTDGRKEIYIDVKWDGNPKLADCLEIELLGDNKAYIDNVLWPKNKHRFVMKDFQLNLKTNQINKLTFYVEIYDRTYKEEESGGYSKNKLLVSKGPIAVNVYYEFHIFGRNILEIRK